MNYKPCAVIPVFNHVSTLEKVVKYIAEKFPVIVVDDGGSFEAKEQIEVICKKFQNCKLVRLDKNSGKGEAVIKGFRVAYAEGFTHCLQVDADGQHDLSVIDQFITFSEENRDAVVCGYPLYDESVPKSRLNGRKITTVCVAIETLSRDIKDAMCGFRIYPLKETIKLISKKKIMPRMDFDIDIVVRLHRTGIPFKFLQVKVLYPEDGISNFRMFRDNVAISKIHTILITTMVLTFPSIIYKNIKRKRL